MGMDLPGLVTRGDEYAWASFSECGSYRYLLGRVWSKSRPMLLFGMLNPSMAGERDDDPTVRRVCGFAQREDFGGVLVINAAAARTPHPRELAALRDPFGPHNAEVVKWFAQRIDVAVAAWGCPPTKIAGRVEWMRGLRKWFCLGTTKDGYPKHPLYLAKDTELEAL